MNLLLGVIFLFSAAGLEAAGTVDLCRYCKDVLLPRRSCSTFKALLFLTEHMSLLKDFLWTTESEEKAVVLNWPSLCQTLCPTSTSNFLIEDNHLENETPQSDELIVNPLSAFNRSTNETQFNNIADFFVKILKIYRPDDLNKILLGNHPTIGLSSRSYLNSRRFLVHPKAQVASKPVRTLAKAKCRKVTKRSISNEDSLDKEYEEKSWSVSEDSEELNSSSQSSNESEDGPVEIKSFVSGNVAITIKRFQCTDGMDCTESAGVQAMDQVMRSNDIGLNYLAEYTKHLLNVLKPTFKPCLTGKCKKKKYWTPIDDKMWVSDHILSLLEAIRHTAEVSA